MIISGDNDSYPGIFVIFRATEGLLEHPRWHKGVIMPVGDDCVYQVCSTAPETPQIHVVNITGHEPTLVNQFYGD